MADKYLHCAACGSPERLFTGDVVPDDGAALVPSDWEGLVIPFANCSMCVASLKLRANLIHE